jgi:hypothetical protein
LAGLTFSPSTAALEAIRFLLTTLNPPIKKINASMPNMTASVTIAPITPATAVEMPEDDEVLLEVEPELEFELELEDELLLT